MANSGKLYKMSELCEISSSKRIYASDYKPQGVPFYRGKEIIEKHNGSIDVSTELFIDRDKFEKIRAKYGTPTTGDLLLTSVGTLGIPYVVGNKEEFYFKDGNLTWFRNFNKKLYSKYLYYWLLSPLGRGELKKCTIGSSQPAYTIALLKSMEIQLPTLEVQRKIVSILTNYDNLIETNIRRIKILEEMVQSLYREWFVKFRFPGHENVKMVRSEFGMIPEGWRIVPYSQLLSLSSGGDWGSEVRTDKENTETYVIRGTDFETLFYGNILDIPIRYITSSSFDKRRLIAGDIIVENSVNAKCRCTGRSLLITDGYLKRMNYSVICSSFCKVFRLKEPKLSPIAYHHMKYLYNEGKMEYFQNVAANGIGNFQATRFMEEAAIIIPGDEKLLSKLLEMLSLVTSSIYSDKNTNLRRTRDLILPKLISGELDVENLDIDTGGA